MSISTAAISAAAAGGGALQLDAPGVLFPAKSCTVGWRRRRTVTNGCRARCMKTWDPTTNRRFEALSYLPPLSDESIAKEVAYMLSKGWIPCLEFDEVGEVHRTNSRIPGYYDGRYWTLWKLPMFGCEEPSQVVDEIRRCREAYPNAYVRLLAFDSRRQCQCMAFVVHKPISKP